MNNYFNFAQAAFNSHPILTVFYCIPTTILFMISISSLIIAFSGSSTPKNTGRHAEGILVVLFSTIGFFFGILFLVSLFFTLNFGLINLTPQYAKSIAETLYTEELNNIKKDSKAAFYQLNTNRKDMNNFKNNLLVKIPQGVILHNKDIMEHLQPLYINCIKQHKIEYIQNIKNEISINDIKDSIWNSQKICAVNSAKNLVELNIWGKYQEKVIHKSDAL